MMSRILLLLLALLALPAMAADMVLIPGTLGTGLRLQNGALLPDIPISDRSAGPSTIPTDDISKLVILGPYAYDLPQAGSPGYETGWAPACLINLSPADASINTTKSVFRGAGDKSVIVLAPEQWACPLSNGIDYITMRAGDHVSSQPDSQPSSPSNSTFALVFSSGAKGVSSTSPYIGQGLSAATASGSKQVALGRDVMVTDLQCTAGGPMGAGTQVFALNINGVDSADQSVKITGPLLDSTTEVNNPVIVPRGSKIAVHQASFTGVSTSAGVACSVIALIE